MQSFEVRPIYSVDDKSTSMDLEHLITQCQNGDREAFGTLYQTYLIPMRKVVTYFIHDSETVWDILHDGFLIAFVSMDSLKNAQKVEAWLTSIMKNLALQHLKEETKYRSAPLSDVAISHEEDGSQPPGLTWEELDMIINRLPEGYGKVFRLAVLDGLSHKEIGELLGIAPHSSSSQLARAKAMMRSMISRYRTGTLSLVAIAILVWHGLFRHREDTLPHPVTSKNTDQETPAVTDTVSERKNKNFDNTILKRKAIHKTLYPQTQKNMAELTLSKDSIPVLKNDSVPHDTIRQIPKITDRNERLVREDSPRTLSTKTSDWTLSLACSGNPGLQELSRHRIPNPGIPDVEGPTDEIEVTEKTHHHIPVVIGLSISKSITSRWSVETGLRYTFLRSDFLSESTQMSRETVQRVHYLGLPLKFNYRILATNGFSLYGQGGGALDIPINGSQQIREHSSESGGPKTEIFQIQPPPQWSAEGGLGIQYRFTPSLSIYAEPSFRYYFNPGSGIKTIRQEKPFEFTIPIGVRLTW